MARIGDPRPSKHLQELTDFTYLRKQIIMYFQTKVLDCRFFFWNKNDQKKLSPNLRGSQKSGCLLRNKREILPCAWSLFSILVFENIHSIGLLGHETVWAWVTRGRHTTSWSGPCQWVNFYWSRTYYMQREVCKLEYILSARRRYWYAKFTN